RYWRGPTWINSAWLVWLGLVRLGYAEQAATLAAAVQRAVLASGLREFYDPFDGHGMGARDFAWSALALELADPDRAAAASHLGAALTRPRARAHTLLGPFLAHPRAPASQ